MSPWNLDELQAVAVADEGGGGSVAWHGAQVVFARADDPTQLLVVDHYLSRDAEYAVGAVLTEKQLEHDVAEGLFRRIKPLRVPSFHRVVCHAGGRCEVVRQSDLLARHHASLREALEEAVRLAMDATAGDAATDAFDAAWDVDPWGLETNVLRCGWRTNGGSDDVGAVEDLLSAWPDPAAYKGVGSRALWNEVAGAWGSPSRRFCDGLLRHARDTAEERLTPAFELAAPVSESVRLKAVLLGALRQRWGLSQPVTFEHDELAEALRGAPEAVAQVDHRLQGVREWRLWAELADRSPARCWAEMHRALNVSTNLVGRARREDLLRVARTWNTLESNLDEHAERSGQWRAALARLTTWHRYDVAPWRQGEQLAQAVRGRWKLGEAPIESVFELLREEFGVRVDGADLGEADASAVGALPVRAPPCAFLGRPSRHDPLASRFAAAHELAHLLLAGREARRDESWFCATGGDPEHDDGERLANAFAAYFLAPRAQVRQFVQRAPGVHSGEFVEWALRVRERFGLTAVTAAEHLLNCTERPKDLPRLPDDVRAKLRAAQKAPTPFEAADAAPTVEAATGRSGAFREALERCVAVGAVTEAKAREVLPTAA
ncbi:MAG: ImmA/IrrE family metallo-endopeptidase [Polyangiales bacterium]